MFDAHDPIDPLGRPFVPVGERVGGERKTTVTSGRGKKGPRRENASSCIDYLDGPGGERTKVTLGARRASPRTVAHGQRRVSGGCSSCDEDGRTGPRGGGRAIPRLSREEETHVLPFPSTDSRGWVSCASGLTTNYIVWGRPREAPGWGETSRLKRWRLPTSTRSAPLHPRRPGAQSQRPRPSPGLNPRTDTTARGCLPVDPIG